MPGEDAERAGPPREALPPLPRLHPLLLAAGIGALWGAAGYAVLWGHSPIAVSRAFVVSVPGTLVLLPVRIVLVSIRLAERWSGRAFHFPDTNWWIGLVAAVVGAALVAGATALVRWGSARLRTS